MCVSFDESVYVGVSSPSGAAGAKPRARCAVARELSATFIISLCVRAAGVSNARCSASSSGETRCRRSWKSAAAIRVSATSCASSMRGRAVLGRTRPAGGKRDPALRAESGRRGERETPRSSIWSPPRRKRLRWALAGRGAARDVPELSRERVCGVSKSVAWLCTVGVVLARARRSGHGTGAGTGRPRRARHIDNHHAAIRARDPRLVLQYSSSSSSPSVALTCPWAVGRTLQYEPEDGCKSASSKKSENTQQSWFGWRRKAFAPPTPPCAARAALAGPRSPAQLTSFCPSPSTHLGKPANGSRGREIQRSTICNPRILQGRGMFDGKAFL